MYVFIPLWIALVIVFQSVPRKSYTHPFFLSFSLICRGLVVWRVLLYLFGLPILGFSILLVIRLQWCPTLNLFLVFIPLWFMDCNSTILFICSCSDHLSIGTYSYRSDKTVCNAQYSWYCRCDYSLWKSFLRPWIFSVSIPSWSFQKSFLNRFSV